MRRRGARRRGAQDAAELRREIEQLKKQLQSVTERLQRLEPLPPAPAPSQARRPTFEANRAAFLKKLDGEMQRWVKLMEPVRGAKVTVYHPDFSYFLTRFGLVQLGALEDRPGIPPSPQHRVQIIRQMKAERVKVILVEPWNDLKLAERVAADVPGAPALVMASSVGAVRGADNYIAAIDYNVTRLAQALK